MATAKRKPQLPRKYEVVYYRWRREVKAFKYSHLDSALGTCFKRMESNRYKATTAEVIDIDTGKIYLTIYVGVDGNLFSFYGPGAKEKARQNRQLLRQTVQEPDTGKDYDQGN